MFRIKRVYDQNYAKLRTRLDWNGIKDQNYDK